MAHFSVRMVATADLGIAMAMEFERCFSHLRSRPRNP
jgi:hypothetical protein